MPVSTSGNVKQGDFHVTAVTNKESPYIDTAGRLASKQATISSSTEHAQHAQNFLAAAACDFDGSGLSPSYIGIPHSHQPYQLSGMTRQQGSKSSMIDFM